MNEQIRAPKVRVIDNKGENLGLMDTAEAIRTAKDQELDLIEISAKADPPVTRIMEYGKYMYLQEKKDKESRKKQTAGKVVTKGVRFGMQTSSHDREFKANNVDKFLKKGYKVKVELIMRGREKALQEIAEKRIEEFLALLSEEYEIQQSPKRYPRGMYFIIKPAK